MAKLEWFWPFNAVFLGLWEISHVLTRGRIPTVSSTARRLPRLLVFAWTAGLARHLTNSSS